MAFQIRKIQYVFIIYWVLLGYIIAALIFWFISLNKQNDQMTSFKLERLNPAAISYAADFQKIEGDKKRKIAQYIGEGATFLGLILAGAIFIFRSVRRQFKETKEQQNFMMAITHELKTPIAVTKLNLETLQKRQLDETQRQRLIHTSLAEANRLDNLCNNLLLSSQLESQVYKMIMEPLSATSLVQEVIAEFKQRYPDVEIEAGLEDDCIINADGFLLKMVLHNILDNSVKYGGKKNILIELTSYKNEYAIRLTDQGLGIADEEKIKVFQKFYRIGNEATRAAKGTGLGLYLCKRIVETHRGTIEVSDATGGGATFTIKLPAVKNI